MKKTTIQNFFFLALTALILSACQATLAPRVTIPQDLPRTAETPLVAAIPGLSLPPFLDQKDHYGQLTQMLDQEGIPSLVILYDSGSDPIPAMADLSADRTSALILRVLPRLVSAVSQENTLRLSRGLPALGELDLVTYSQGSVIAWDLFRRLMKFKSETDRIVSAVGPEWDYLQKDPLFESFTDALINYLLIDNLKVQYTEAFKKYVDLNDIHARAEKNLLLAKNRLKTYVSDEKLSAPEPAAAAGTQDAYPRGYPRLTAWLDQNYPPQSPERINFFTNYALYRNLLPLRIRIFSIAGSFLGSPDANVGSFFIHHFPGISKHFVKNRANQIDDTRLGNQHSLDWIKYLLEWEKGMDPDRDFANIYFVAGAHGSKGDGLVEQSSAHLCLHRLSQIPVQDILDSPKDALGSLKYQELPFYPLSALNIWHLPKDEFFYKIPGAAQMGPHAPAYPYLLAFLKKDAEKLKELGTKETTHLRQFMVLVYFSGTWEKLKDHEFKLKSDSEAIKIDKPIDNQTTHALAWSGYFPSGDHLDTENTSQVRQAKVTLEIKSPAGKLTTAEITVTPGVTSFIEITS